MKTCWFTKFGWAYRPVAPMGWLLTGLAALFCVQVFTAVDRHSHSVSDTLYGVLPYFVSAATVLGWVAANTSPSRLRRGENGR